MPESGKPPILVVDDEPDILFSLRALLRRDFDVHTAGSGAEALDVLSRVPVEVVMTDQRMPEMTGAELLARARAECPRAVRIVFTGYADLKAVIDAVNRGEVYRYLTKPWDPDELVAVLHQACEHYEQYTEQLRLLADLREYVQHGPGGAAAGEALLGRIDRALAAAN